MQNFDGLKTKSQITEDPQQTLARFKAGLKPKIKQELLCQPLYSLEHVFQVALDMGEYVGYSFNRKPGATTMEFAHKKLHDTSRIMKTGSSHPFNPPIGFKPSSSQMADPKGKGIKCFKCQQPGHMAYNCPKKNLHIGLEHEEEPKLQMDKQNENSFDYGVDDPVDLDDEVGILLAFVVTRILATPKIEEEDRHQTSIFHMLVRCGNHSQKLIIDNGNCMNVVSTSTIEHLKLPVEPHPQPYKVTWINNKSIPANQRCFISLSCGVYSDSIWCDVTFMKGGHMILGCLWLYDQDVHHCGKENTYSFMFKNQKGCVETNDCC